MKKLVSGLAGGVCIALLLASCSQPATEIFLEAEKYKEMSGEFQTRTLESGQEVILIPEGGWISFDVPVEIAGRYKVQVHLSAVSGDPVSCWIEDYIDNKDDRTYNITGSMALEEPDPAGTYVTVHRDGSPLNAVTHPMKLHVDKGEAAVDWIKFTLIKEWQPTPEILQPPDSF